MKNIVPHLRSERGWAQAELATRLKVSRQTVNAIELERYELSLSLAFAIAALFEKSVESNFQDQGILAPPHRRLKLTSA
jgi:putative transcriptional regulator